MDDRVHILPFGSLWSSPGVAFLSPNLFPSVKSMELKSHEEVSKEKDAEESEKGVPSSTKVISKIHTKKGHAYFTSRRLKLDFFSTTRRPECVLHPWTRIFCQESSNYDDARISVFHISSIEARSASRVVLTVEGNAERVKRNVRICGIETCFASPSFIIDKGCWIALQMGEDGIVPCRVETIEFGPTTRDGDILFGKITPTTRFEFRSKTLTKEIDIHSDAMLNRLRAISGASAWRTCQDLLFSMEHRKLKDRSSVVGVKGLPLPQSLLIWGAPGVGKTHFLSMLQEYLTLHLGCACCAFNAEKAWIYPQRIRHGTWSLPDGVQVKSKIRMETTEDGIHDFMNTTTRPTCLIMDDMDDILSWDPLTLQEQHGGSIEGIGELQKKFDDIVSWRRKDTSRTLIACVRDISGVLHRFRAGGDTFHMEAYIPNPDERQRVELMTNFLSSDSSSFENIRSLHLDGEAVESLALNLSKPTQGFVARDIVQLFHRANGMIHKYFRHDISLNLEALKSIFDKACRSVVPSELEDLSTIVSVSQKKEDLAGYKWLMNRILKLMRIAFLQSEDQKEAEHLGVGRTKGIFLFGPSGCGKTHMIRCVAGEINASFVEVRSTDVFSKYFGESERRLRSLFARARRLSPCVLVFEEMDSLAPDRSAATTVDDGGVSKRVLSTLLNELDGIAEESGHIVVVGCSNRPDMIDPAILRPGRFDHTFWVRKPDEENRLAILQHVSKTIRLDPQLDMSILSKKTEGFSCAGIIGLCREAGFATLEESKGKEPESGVGISEKSFEAVLTDASKVISLKVKLDDDRHCESFAKSHGLFDGE